MTQEEVQLTMMCGVIARLEQTQKDEINRFAAELRDWISKGGDFARIALALVGAEIAAKD